MEANNPATEITLSWKFDTDLPLGLNLKLFDKTRNQIIDMLDCWQYIFRKLNTETQPNFQIITGNNDFINQQLSALEANYPEKFQLFQNYPNPFNSECIIQYNLNHASKIQLGIYNVTGQVVRILVDEQKAAGFYTIQWNGTNTQNETVVSGVYFCVLKSDIFSEKIKLIMLR